MYLRAKKRIKDGKEHRYWSIVESCRNLDGRVVQRQVLYLGEINDSQKTAWCRTIEVLQVDSSAKQMALFPADRPAPELECEVVQVKLNELRLHHPRQWGACWLALTLWEQLELDRFWRDRLPASRQGTKWLEVLKTQVCYQLIDPGSEWRLHRHWYAHSAMRDLLGSPVRVLSDDTLYRCLDKLLAHKRAFFSFLRQRWEVLFQARFDVLLYDLTSTYFESDPPFAGKRQFGYSRDKRSDCVQVVIALVVTPQGFPLAYEVMPGNTSDKTTLKDFLKQIEAQYGRSDRVWIMDRGIPTEETLEQMRTGDSPVHYLVGTPKGRLSKFEKKFLTLPWQAVRPSVDVKLLSHDSELYILARSHPRTLKERAMRRRRLKKLWRRLHELQQQTRQLHSHVQRREQRGGTVTFVVVCHRRAAPFLHRQTGLRAVQGLDRALLVKAEHRGVVRRVEVQPDYIAQLLLKARVIAELEGADQVRLQAMGAPHPVNEAVGRVQMPCHRPARPMGGVVRCRLCRRLDHLAAQLRLLLGVLAAVIRSTRAFLLSARRSLFRNTSPPAPYLVRVHLQLRGNLLIHHALGCHQDDSRTLA